MRWASILLGTLLGIQSAQALDVEGWRVEYFPNTQEATGCSMNATYRDGTSVVLIVDHDYEWRLGFVNPTWRLTKGARTSVDAYVDGILVTKGTAISLDKNLAVLPLAGGNVYRALQAGRGLVLKTPVGELNFHLAGTARAMDAVLDCVKFLNSKQSQQPAEHQAAAPQSRTGSSCRGCRDCHEPAQRRFCYRVSLAASETRSRVP